MLFPFEPSRVSFTRCKIKSVSTALGGSAIIVDEAESVKKNKEVCKRITIPMSVARMYKVKYKTTKHIVPQEGAIMYYGDLVVGIEKAFENKRVVDGITGPAFWPITMETHFKEMLNLIKVGQWYFDGTFVYHYKDGIDYVVEHAQNVSSDGRFRIAHCETVQINYLNFAKPALSNRTCLVFVINGKYAITPPIWKSIGGVGNSNTSKRNQDKEDIGINVQFDRVDNTLAINLNFVLNAGKTISEQFGYSAIQPLQLPKLMLQLKTVNLPNIPQEVKSTFDCGLNYTHCVAWLMGLVYNSKTFDQMLAIRRLLKYLTTKGVYNKKSIEKENLFQRDMTVADVPVLSAEEAGAVAQQAFGTFGHGWANREAA